MAIAPQTTSYQRDRVGEGGQFLLIPGSGPHRHRLAVNQLCCHQRDQREEPEKNRRRASNRRIGPLPLRFDSEMNSGLFECYFYFPSTNENLNYLLWRVIQISREQCL